MAKRKRRRSPRVRLNAKTIQQHIPTAVGGAAALLANPIIDPVLGSNGWVSGLAKTAVGTVVAVSFNNSKIATGFGVTMAAFGVGQLANKAITAAGQKPLAGLPISGVPYRTLNNHMVARQVGNGQMLEAA